MNNGPPSPRAFFCEEEHLSKSCPFIFLRKCNGLPKGFSFRTLIRYKSSADLRPDPSKFNQQVDFCFITARRYIWLCKTNELTPTLHGYLKYMKSIHRIHNHQTASQSLPKEWTFLNGILNFNHLLVPRSPMPLIILLYILAFFSFYNECCLC